MDSCDLGAFLTELNQRIRRGCTAHVDQHGRLYYMNHETRTSSWLPPVESWNSGGTGLPYGWEAAIDKEGKTYFINHVNKTTTYEDPRKDIEEEPPPIPREVELFRDPQLGFGFVAGSEKPVIVRFVTEGGPSENKLQPGDQILKINGEDVKSAPREHVIELVKSCKHSVKLTVCQPHVNNSTRKSALLTAAKKAKLKSNPSRVRFAEGVVINGSPLYCPSTFESCVPFMPNVLKVFLENGQTKSFKYDSSTTVQDVLDSLQEKLSLKCMEHFSLVVEHIKSVRKNKLTLLDPKDTLAKIAARPGAHHLRCLFRIAFVPRDAYDLLQKDPIAFEYLYVQCCNDMVQERFAPELKYDVALRLAALHIQQHALSSGMQGKITVKSVERESGLKRFVPESLLETMKRKELRKLLSHFLKQNQSLSAPGQKQLTALQAKLHYLKIISELPSYGAKCFSTNMKDSTMETAILISPKFGISQLSSVRNTYPSQPMTLAHIEEVSSVSVKKDDELSYFVEINLKHPDRESLKFSLEDREAEELVLILKGYHHLLASRDLPVHWECDDPWKIDAAPCFHSQHSVNTAPWSYPPSSDTKASPPIPTVDLSIPPPQYIPCELPERTISRSSSREQCVLTTNSNSVDHNMNETFSHQQNVNESVQASNASPKLPRTQELVQKPASSTVSHPTSIDSFDDEKDIDYQSVVSIELLEDTSETVDIKLLEVKNDEVLRRVTEMRKIVADAENYLSDGKIVDAHNESISSEEREVVEEQDSLEIKGQIKAADSLLLLTQIDDVTETINPTAVTLGENEASPSESDTDSFSTPNDSPLHRATQLRNSTEGHPRATRSGSSFGLHSPDMLPGLGSGDKELLELLKQLQSNPDIQLPFAEGTLYLDPDIIDLTMIPPPITPDTEIKDTPTQLDHPPTPFLDRVMLKELEGKLAGNSIQHETGEGESSTEGSAVVDSARVVAELDHLCDALTELQTASEGGNLPSLFHLDFPGCEDLDSFIASVTVPPPPSEASAASSSTLLASFQGDQDDISAYIIPPPPSCLQSTEVQDEVIARFRQASDDIRRMMAVEHSSTISLGENSGKKDEQKEKGVVEVEVSSHVAEPPPLEALKVFDALANGCYTEFSSEGGNFQQQSASTGSKSTSVLKSKNEPKDDSHTYANYSFLAAQQQQTPVYANLHSLTLGSHPRKLQNGTINDYEEVVFGGHALLNHQNGAIINGGAYVNGETSKPKVPPRMKKAAFNPGEHVHKRERTCSCDDVCFAREPSPATGHPTVSRSHSWTNLQGLVVSPISNRKLTNHSAAGKPPLPPASPSNQENRKILKGPPICQCAGESNHKCPRPSMQGASGNSPRSMSPHGSPASPRKKIPSRTASLGRSTKILNGVTTSSLNSLNLCLRGDILNGGEGHLHLVEPQECVCTSESLTNGCVCKHSSSGVSNGKSQTPPLKTSSPKLSSVDKRDGICTMCSKADLLENALGKDVLSAAQESPYVRAQQEIYAMVLRLDDVTKNILKNGNSDVDINKFVAAKEALIVESRQFVTASKLFVKSATESSDKILDNLVACVALLDRIFTVTELVIMHMGSSTQIAVLVEQLKGVALTYTRTVNTAGKSVDQELNNSNMGVLMHQATDLASALTALMRTLRSFSSA